jgi:hypothetical protein
MPYLKRILSVLVAVAAALQTSGCVTMSTASHSTSFDAQSKTGLVIFGVSPNYRVGAKKGPYTTDDFQNSELRLFEFNLFPAAGYVVSTVSPTVTGEAYALLQILPEGIGGPAFKACDGLKAATFQAEPGKVTYLGEFEYQFEGRQLRILHAVDLQRAVEHLRATYPQIKAELTYVEPAWLTVKGLSCTTTIYVPVILPPLRR